MKIQESGKSQDNSPTLNTTKASILDPASKSEVVPETPKNQLNAVRFDCEMIYKVFEYMTFALF